MNEPIRFSRMAWERQSDGWARVQYIRHLLDDDKYTEWKRERTFAIRLTDKEYFVKKLDGTL
jgi:hypothetical protein